MTVMYIGQVTKVRQGVIKLGVPMEGNTTNIFDLLKSFITVSTQAGKWKKAIVSLKS